MDNKPLTIPDLPQKRERNYGIDLLRLVAMLMVVTLHILGYGGVLESLVPFSLKSEVFWSIEILCFVAVNVYAIISGIVGYKSRHRSSSLIYTCLQLLFLSVVITVIDIIMLTKQGTPITFDYVFFNIFPSIRLQWYFSAYFCLFFFMPLIDKVIEVMPKRALKVTALFCFLVFCCWSQYETYVAGLRQGYSVIWLAILYGLGAYIAKYDPLKKWKSWQCLLVFLGSAAITVASHVLIGKFLKGSLKPDLLVQYTSPTMVIGAVFLVSAFAKMNFKRTAPKKIISHLSPLAFGVYLIHCHPILAGKMTRLFWDKPGYELVHIAKFPIWYGLLAVVCSALAIFAICLFIEWLRFLLFKLIRVKKFSEWLEKIFKKITKPILGE